MLVRRFSMAVETEKQYAIEQFLAVAAPKDSRVRTISELVERTLASAGIGMESVTLEIPPDVDLSLGASWRYSLPRAVRSMPNGRGICTTIP